MQVGSDLLTHARKFGCDQVYEYAATLYAGSELARLKIELRKIADGHKQTRRQRPPEASTWYEGVPAITDEDLVALHAEPLTPKEVALLAGVPVKRVYRAIERGSEATHNVESSTEPSYAA